MFVLGKLLDIIDFICFLTHFEICYMAQYLYCKYKRTIVM